MTDRPTNWAGNVVFGPSTLHHPTSIDEVRRIVSGATQVRALGSGHSFNPIADTIGDQISLTGMPPLLHIDSERSTVTVGGGVRYGELAPQLHRAGYALHNLGSLPHICIAGATATGTHGSGAANGNLATAVRALDLVTASGDVVTLEIGDDDFAGAVVGLGMLGIVTSVTLAIEPTFDVAQYVYDDLSLTQFIQHLDTTMNAAYSVSVFTDWRRPVMNQVWVKHRTNAMTPGQFGTGPRFMDASLADGPRHPVPGVDPAACTKQDGVPGPWHERLPHFRLDFTPSSGDELQSEYFVPRDAAVAAVTAISSIAHVIAPVLQICELRTIAADRLWLSPAYSRDSVAIHFTWIRDIAAVSPVLEAIEDQLGPFDARPHWGKVFEMNADVVRGRYERMPDFSALLGRFDPTGKFRNAFVDTFVPAAG
ncbi:MAG TPA: FAD-binding protein [Acidothermaceae bacterium]